MFKLKKPDTTEIGNKFKSFFKKIGKRNLVIVLAVFIIGGAVWLNVALFSGGLKSDKDNSGVAGTDGLDGPSYVNGDETEDAGQTGDSSYFASAQIGRKRSRDEALEVLQLVVDNPEALDESKSVAMAEITQIATDMDNESKIETLVMAKGFEKCIAVISDSKCNIIVKTNSALLPNQSAQIFEIVYDQTGITPVNVHILEKTD